MSILKTQVHTLIDVSWLTGERTCQAAAVWPYPRRTKVLKHYGWLDVWNFHCLLESACIPSLPTMWPRNFTKSLLNAQLFALSVDSCCFQPFQDCLQVCVVLFWICTKHQHIVYMPQNPYEALQNFGHPLLEEPWSTGKSEWNLIKTVAPKGCWNCGKCTLYWTQVLMGFSKNPELAPSLLNFCAPARWASVWFTSGIR